MALELAHNITVVLKMDVWVGISIAENDSFKACMDVHCMHFIKGNAFLLL